MPSQPNRKGPSDAQDLPVQSNRNLNDVFSLVYEELRSLASHVRREDFNATLNSTALVHECWLKLKDSAHLAHTSVAHFKAIAANAMRQVLVDEARRRNARKRGGSGEAIFVTLEDFPMRTGACSEDLLAVDAALKELSQLSARQAEMVEYRFFGGLNVAETAEVMQVSASVVERDCRAARAWLASRIRPAQDDVE